MVERKSKTSGTSASRHRAISETSAAAIANAELRAQALELERKISFHRRTDPPPATLLGPTLKDWYQRHVEKPGKVLASITESWIALVPPDICKHTRLASLTRGVLHVLVSNSVFSSELNIHLRQGLLFRLQNASKGAVYRVKITISSQL